MLNATLTKNVKANGFELRLHEQVSKQVWNYLCNEMGMNWIYSKTEKTPDGKRQVILYRSYDLSKPQNKRSCVKYSPEKTYELLAEKTSQALAQEEPKAKRTSKKSAEKAETKKPQTSKKSDEPKAKPLEKMTKAELIALLTQGACEIDL